MTALKKEYPDGKSLEESQENSELCHCRRVKQNLIVKLLQMGALHQQEVMQRTGAGTGCGTCRPMIRMLIQQQLNPKSH